MRGSAGPPGGSIHGALPAGHGREHAGPRLQTSDLSREARCWDVGVCQSSPFYMADVIRSLWQHADMHIGARAPGAGEGSWWGSKWTEDQACASSLPAAAPLPLRAWPEQRSVPLALAPSEGHLAEGSLLLLGRGAGRNLPTQHQGNGQVSHGECWRGYGYRRVCQKF